MESSERFALREAAEWFACMKGPDGPARQAQFDAWLASSELNRAAYSDVAETFSLGKNLRPQADWLEVQSERKAKAKGSSKAKPLILVGAACAIAMFFFWARPPSPEEERGAASAPQFATSVGEIREIRLSDGSLVTLDTDTQLSAAFGAERRELWLQRGRARFDVAHDGRLFVVHAGGGEIIARGTVFDVRLDGVNATVQLLRGAIDVTAPRVGRAGGIVRKVAPGESVAFGASSGVNAVSPEQAPQIVQATWPEALLAFDSITVGNLAKEASRYSNRKLVVRDPVLAARPVSGTFRVSDPRLLAESMATLLDAEVVVSQSGDFVLQDRAP